MHTHPGRERIHSVLSPTPSLCRIFVKKSSSSIPTLYFSYPRPQGEPGEKHATPDTKRKDGKRGTCGRNQSSTPEHRKITPLALHVVVPLKDDEDCLLVWRLEKEEKQRREGNGTSGRLICRIKENRDERDFAVFSAALFFFFLAQIR